MITGGAGFIGSNLANHFLAKGHRVVIFDSLARNGCIKHVDWLQKNNNSRNFQVLIGDVGLPTHGFQDAVENSDAVFHMAGQVAVTTSVSDPVLDFD